MATAPTPQPQGPGTTPTGPSAAPAQNPLKVFAAINQLAQAAGRAFPACAQELSQISDLTQQCMQKAVAGSQPAPGGAPPY